MVNMLAFLDPGPFHVPKYRGPEVADLREFAEIMRRLFIPYYEEARRYWERARNDDFFDDPNEVWLYLSSTSQAIIARYAES